MEKNRICKICNKRFANGKAMGGHMRSHLAKLPLPPKPIQQQDEYPPYPIKPPSPSSSSSLNYPSSRNPMQSYRSVNHKLPFMLSKPNLSIAAATNDDGESETDSPRNNPTQKRSKRARKSIEKVAESSPEQVSSISDIFNEEDVALCLLMLSKDKWTRIKYVYMEEEESAAEAENENENEADDEDESYGVITKRSKGKYWCETCKKGFRSYQALGGHRANHKKIRTHVKQEEYEEDNGRGSGGGGAKDGNCVAAVVNHRIFKCPFCVKVFDSGQALGGHKKVHFSYLGNFKISAKSSDNLLDLNLPAPEDDNEVSQTEPSTIANTRAYYLRN